MFSKCLNCVTIRVRLESKHTPQVRPHPIGSFENFKINAIATSIPIIHCLGGIPIASRDWVARPTKPFICMTSQSTVILLIAFLFLVVMTRILSWIEPAQEPNHDSTELGRTGYSERKHSTSLVATPSLLSIAKCKEYWFLLLVRSVASLPRRLAYRNFMVVCC